MSKVIEAEQISLRLPGYKIEKDLYRYDGRVVYRAQRLADDVAVAIETLDAEYPDRQQVAEIRHDGTIAQRLAEVDGVRKIHDVLNLGSGNIALVGDLFECTLKSRLVRAGGKGLPVSEVLNIAQRLARILGDIHANGIVHKALSPEHVLFDPASGAISLAGFSFASELNQERQAVSISRRLQGPLPYISPEQTGRMNRDLDYRSDYYSLGVLLFELLTGELPFQADSMLEWVYCHISRLPPALHEISTEVPEAVSAIVLKLLAKNSEARYQSVDGLIHDLAFCTLELAADREIKSFELGEKDVVEKFLVPQNLYGRERELEKLLELFEEVEEGAAGFCLVHGYSGVGKTALVNEIDQPVVRQHGFLIQGKFEQFQHGEAYTALAVAFRSLIQQVLAEPEARLLEWRQQVLDALGLNTRLVVDLVPELELIVGKQPEIPELPPVEARNRLHIVLTAFLRVFSGEGHPVVLFLDDLQWSDAPTLELLRRLVTSHELSHLLIIGAYRSNEVGAGHPIRLLLDDLQPQKNICQIALAPLDQGSVSQLVANALHCDSVDICQLSDLLYHKAQGNPFFTNELLRLLHKEGAIAIDPVSGKWNWNQDSTHLSDVSNDVVEFMVDGLRQLQPETQNVLKLAACIGGTFDLHILAAIYEHSIAETATALLPALKQHTVLPLHSDYRLVGETTEPLDFNLCYRFEHDHVQKAAYALIEPQQLAEVHLSIGRLMLQFAGDTTPGERLIDIVDHLNEGRLLIASAEERQRVAELNLLAGTRVKHSAAYDEALKYLRIAEELLPKNPWSSIPEFMRTLVEETQQCAYLTGNVEEAENWIEVMLKQADSDLERGNILAIRTRQYATLGRMEESILSAIQGLAILGVELTEQPTMDDIARERKKVEENLGDRAVSELVNARLVDDPATLTAMRLFMEIFAAAFLSGSGKLFPYLVLKAVNLSLRHGNCPESAFAYAAYGMLLCGELDEPALGYQYGKVGLAINERFDDLTLRARVIYVYAMFIHHWSNHWSSLTPWFRKGIEAGYQSGDLLYLAYSAQDYVIWDPTLDLEKAYKQHADKLEIVRECAYQDSFDSATLFMQLQRNLLGLTDSLFSFSDNRFDEALCLAGMHKRQFMTGIANYHIYSAEICLLYGDFDRALEHVRAQDALIKSVMSLPQLVRFYIVAFLTLATHYPDMDADEQATTRERLERDLARMSRWADNCEENFRHLQYLMSAELKRLDACHEDALKLYDAAIDAAGVSGFIRDQATACERAARHLLALGHRRAAEGYLRRAHHLYKHWGARRKVTLLEREFSVLLELVVDYRPSNVTLEMDDLDMASVMKASREISGEIVLQRLLKTTMGILLENAGGQWGCLVIRRGDSLLVEAALLPAEGLSIDNAPVHSLVQDSSDGQIPLPVTLINQVLNNGEAVVLGDASQEGQYVQYPYMLKFKPLSVLCVPLNRGGFEAVLYMENNLSSGVFTEARVEVIRLLTAQASVAIENARLYEQVQNYSRTLEDKVSERTARLEQLNQDLHDQANRDGLTGVANRRQGDAYLEEVWARLRREKLPLSVIMLDVDHFKLYNDNYGHQAGDDTLIAVAEAVNEQLLRPADMVSRYGGEEFMLILPDVDRNGVASVGEKVRQSIEMLGIKHEHSLTSTVITVSLGTATIVPDVGGNMAQLIREADKALYNAKRMGRNKLHSAP